YVVRDGTLVITSPEDADSYRTAQAYPVTDLVRSPGMRRAIEDGIFLRRPRLLEEAKMLRAENTMIKTERDAAFEDVVRKGDELAQAAGEWARLAERNR